MNKKFVSSFLAVCLLAGSLPVTALAENTEEAAPKDCHSMTEEWFGNKNKVSLMALMDEGNSLDSVISGYFSAREQDYAGISRTRMMAEPSTETSSQSQEVQDDMDLRAENIAVLQDAAGIQITDAEITTLYGADDVIYHEDGTMTLFVYEWTFFDYDDLSDGEVLTDVSGYGTYHKITLEETDGTYLIVSDEYDESDILGICTMNESTEAELEAMDYEPVELAEFTPQSIESEEVMPASAFYSGYDPKKAAEYADKWVSHNAGITGQVNYEGYYNSAYYNFNPDGGDCANYVSQSIYAGGMSMVVGTAYGTDGWYYKSANNRSATWTSAKRLREWMAANRGNYVTAEKNTVYMGSPVFYNNAHATICVGLNSAGTPIINSHNYDRYHVIWNYWEEGTVYTTVQLTANNSAADQVPKGYLEHVNGGENSISVSGWAYDPDTPDQPVTVDVYADGRFIGNCKASSYRTDFDKNYGFSLTIPYEVTETSTCNVTVYALNTTGGMKSTKIGEGNVTVTPQKQDQVPKGYLERVNGGENSISVSGWAYDPDTPDQPVTVDVYADGKFIGNCKANAYRADLDKNCGFFLTIPQEVTEESTYKVTVYALNTTGGMKSTKIGEGDVTVTPTPHTHTYSLISSTEVSCTTAGRKVYTCSCGDSYTELTIPGHSYGPWTVLEEPAENSHGMKEHTCEVCGRVQKVITKLPKPVVQENPFNDVTESDYFYDAVLWNVGNEITSGWTETEFAPEMNCNRAQAVTFIWRANGAPKPESTEILFKDIEKGAYYCDAVLWAVESGITKGYQADSFAPERTLTRGEFVTFLYRSEGKPSCSAKNIFTDVTSADYYYDAVLWAVENGITEGTGDNQFSPNDQCQRGQVVTFIHRAYHQN
ncbi:MAG: S-layer homology domain-containing protein [Lachnospiraceae bacterium]